ncbi:MULTISPECIES: VOC family protein [unclassified Kribbella]|uniref:VOC family protein n=1 Tax=unclassified Kribbella TaxID=2644121 RepID=UPI00301A9B1C
MNDVVIRPLRFTADVAAMQVFLETLGLQARIESERGGWAVLLAGRGAISLHDAATSDTGGQPGQTNLTFEAEDIDELKERLESAGYDDATIWDEAFGRVLSATGPDGTKLWIDERSEDLYGYKVHETRPDERWSVTPHLSGADQPAWERLLDVLGTDQPIHFGAGPELAVRPDLTTAADLDDVLQRLVAAGYAATRTDQGLEVVDPDGQPLVVHG